MVGSVVFRRAVALALVSLILGLCFARALQSSGNFALADFRAAYCESRAAAHALDPYDLAIVAPCELTPAGDPNVSVEPLAPFTLALLAPVALLPYGAAVRLYLALALLAVCCSIYAVRCATRLPLFVLVATFAIGVGVATFSHGTLAPFSLASICVSALLLRRGEDGWAGLVAAGTLVDPLVGAAVCATLAIYRPLTRVPLFIATLVVLILSGAALGPAGTAAYYFDVLPASLTKSLIDGTQYGLAYLLHEAGFSDRLAATAGLAWDVLVVASAVPIAHRCARLFGSTSGYATVPAAVVLLGGSIVDLSHVALALPACCLAVGTSRFARTRALCALVLIAVPWPILADALGRVRVAALPALDLGNQANQLALKSPTWFGLMLLFLIFTRRYGRATLPMSAARPLLRHADER